MEESNGSAATYWPSTGPAGYVQQPLPSAEEEMLASQPVVVVMKSVRRWRVRVPFRHIFRWAGVGMVCMFAGIGFLFTAVFVGMHFGLLNVRGTSEARNEFYETLPKASVQAASISRVPTATSCVQEGADGQAVSVCVWNTSAEWDTVRGGLTKDKDIILDVSQKTSVPARMIAASVAPEQLRWFTSDREVYKRYFEPMKILGSMTEFSLGIAGFKQDTARKVEQYTVDTNSPFYAGDGMAALIEYPAGVNHDSVLYNRLTDSKNHYYSYLYAALFIKEIQAQWASQGYDISDRPDVIATLFNIGFRVSQPKANPQIGGTSIHLNGEMYSYGELGTAFYRSDELTAIFPLP